MLERAVTWIIILIVIVFDPLAVIMLLAAQMTFQWAREQKEKIWVDDQADELTEAFNDPIYATDVGKKPTQEEIEELPITADSTNTMIEPSESELDKWNKMIEEAEREVSKTIESTVEERVAKGETYIDGEGHEVTAEEIAVTEPVYSEEDGSKKKTYMMKDSEGNIQTKLRE
jgi:regulatory protein YycI of two-component signal transduction system YycFG